MRGYRYRSRKNFPFRRVVFALAGPRESSSCSPRGDSQSILTNRGLGGLIFPLPAALFAGRGCGEAAGEGSSGLRPGSFANFANDPVRFASLLTIRPFYIKIPSFSGEVAQWWSSGLISHWLWVQIPPSPLKERSVDRIVFFLPLGKWIVLYRDRKFSGSA